MLAPTVTTAPTRRPALLAFTTLAAVVLVCAGAVVVKLDVALPPPSAFTAATPLPQKGVGAVQLRVESVPVGARCTGPQGMVGVTPFFVDVPVGVTVELACEKTGHHGAHATVVALHAQRVEVHLLPW